MPKYYRFMLDKSNLSKRSGSNTVIPLGFNELSSSLISQCSFIQSLIQQVIYITHGAEIFAANKTLKEFPNPKARIDFLCEFPFGNTDEIVSSVFDYSRSLFRDLYEFRNVLAHEIWSSSEDYENSIIFSKLDEESRLLMVSGKMWHIEGTSSRDVYNATIRYISNVKIASCSDLHSALKDADLCAWILMHIGNVINEPDPVRKEEARRAFLVFKGTSHLFGSHTATSEPVNFQTSRSKNIQG